MGTPPPPLDLGQYARLSDTQKLRVYTAYVAHGGDQSASPPGYVVERRCDGARGSARPAAAAAAAAGAEPAPVVEVAEGLRLHVSSSNATDYVAVGKKHSRFQVQHTVAGRRVFLGCFDTAVAAAVAYARVVGKYHYQPPAVATEAEGLRLQLSSSSGTGYRGVRKRASGRFQADHKVDGGMRVHLSTFATAVEAAVAYTRAVGEAEEAPPRPAKRSLKPADAPPLKRRSTAAGPLAASIGMPAVVQALERVGLPQ